VDVGLDRVGCEGYAIWPGIVEQLISGQDLAGTPEQALEDRELTLAEVHRFAGHGHASRTFVQLERPCAQRHRLAAGWPPPEGSEPRQKLLVRERLDEIVVRTGVQAFDPIADGITRGEHQDRDLRALAAEHSGYLEAGTIRQADVEDDRVEFGSRSRDFQALLSRQGRLYDVTVLGQQPLEKPAESSVVFDDQKMHCVS
jgi:hypothetical protein